MAIQGRIDAITASGFIEGWAIDSGPDPRPVAVSVVDEDEIAYGLANLYREDLAVAGLGYGWCFFRLRTAAAPEMLHSRMLELRDRRSSTVIDSSRDINFVRDDFTRLHSIDQVLAHDPLTVQDVGQLRFCEPILGAYIRQHGIRQFVRTTYLYVLGRPADESGIVHYGRLIRRGVIMPFSLVELLSKSDEFQRSQRVLSAPTSPDFAYSLS